MRSFLRRYGSLYVALVVVFGALAIVDGASRLVSHPVPASWLVLAALTWVSGSFALRVPQLPASISVSETFVFMILLLFGGPPATLTVAVDGLLTSALRPNRQIRRLLFNVAEPAVSTWAAWQAFAWFSGAQPLIVAPNTLGALVLPMVLMTSVYFLMNSWLTALAIATDTGLTPLQIWRTHFVGVSLSYFAGASVALLVALNTREVSWWSFGAVLPLVFLLYGTFSGRIRRTEDANRHLAELNRLHLSTVESLAMAIDAKDQVTHGHIRRVQTQAVVLGQHLLCGERELKALEAAALLHDMGKLAVPDYILNKPGKLTPPEYERVKHHAVVGAEILSAVEFPYPVVPIVRHHHENWDGSGYPDGLSGNAIPIGARILAVVDCYDALTSDRPYRRALPAHEALAIIEDRRGHLYDPLVVDAFVALQPSLGSMESPAPTVSAPASAPIAPISHDALRPASHETGALTGHDVAAAVLEAWTLVQTHADTLGGADLIELVARRIRRLTPATLVIALRTDGAAQELTAAHASGPGEELIGDLRIPFGRGISGGVAANQAPLANGDPALDLLARLEGMAPPLESSLTIPLVSGSALVGVLACYAPRRAAFSDEHLRIVNALGARLAPELDRAWAAGQPGSAFKAPGVGAGSDDRSCALVLVRTSRAAAMPAGDVSDSTTAVEAAALRLVRAADLVVRGDAGEILVLCARADMAAGQAMAERLRSELAQASPDATPIVGVAIAPDDGSSLDALVGAARTRARGGVARAAVHGSLSSDREGVPA
jgi:putative nucleotidyltransferase with HDIG domain